MNNREQKQLCTQINKSNIKVKNYFQEANVQFQPKKEFYDVLTILVVFLVKIEIVHNVLLFVNETSFL